MTGSANTHFSGATMFRAEVAADEPGDGSSKKWPWACESALILGISLFLGLGLAAPQPAGEPGKDKTTTKPADPKSDTSKSAKEPPKTVVEPPKAIKELPAEPPVIMSNKEYKELLDKIRKLESNSSPTTNPS